MYLTGTRTQQSTCNTFWRYALSELLPFLDFARVGFMIDSLETCRPDETGIVDHAKIAHERDVLISLSAVSPKERIPRK